MPAAHPLPPPARLSRLADVLSVLVRFGLAEWVGRRPRPWLGRRLRGRDGRRLDELPQSVRLRLAIEELGGTFLKIGQLLASRPDLVGQEAADELARLRAGVPADPFEAVTTVLATELGRPVETVFRHLDPQPIASGSIAQVHRATLADGRTVAVKIQHPGVEERVSADLVLLGHLAGLAARHSGLARFQPEAVVAELGRMLRDELDFTREARHLERFRGNFAGDPSVRFPAPLPGLASRRVLVMELLEGVPFANLAQPTANGAALARRGAHLWLEMLFRDRFYHADPHPGNLLLLPDGAIGVLDAGMANALTPRTAEALEEILAGIATGDAAAAARAVVHLCQAPRGFDEVAFADDLAELAQRHGRTAIDQLDLAGALRDFADLIARHRLILPGVVARLLRMLMLLDGTARDLGADVSLAALAHPYARTLLKRRLSPLAQARHVLRASGAWWRLAGELPQQVGDILDLVRRGRLDVHLEHHRLEPVVNRLVSGVVLAALFLGSALLWRADEQGLRSWFGLLGCLVSGMLALRLLWRTRHQG